jgi:hypothetical protein
MADAAANNDAESQATSSSQSDNLTLGPEYQSPLNLFRTYAVESFDNE